MTTLDDAESDAAEQTEAPGREDALATMQALVEEVNDIDDRIAKNTDRIAELRARRNAILSRELIDLMDNHKVDHLGAQGRTFVSETFCKASITKDNPRAQAAYDWLEANDGADLLKRQVVVQFPDGFQDEADRLAQYARENYQMARVTTERAVPWARLTSWVKERLKKGLAVEMDLLGASAGRYVKVKEPRSE